MNLQRLYRLSFDPPVVPPPASAVETTHRPTRLPADYYREADVSHNMLDLCDDNRR